MTAITSALLIQEQEFRRRLAALEDELADLQRQLRLALSDTGAPGSAAPPVPTSPVVRLKHVDFYEAPGGTFQRFTASQIDAGEVVFAPIPGGVIEHNDKMWIRVRLTTTGGAERVGYFDAEQVRADWTATK